MKKKILTLLIGVSVIAALVTVPLMTACAPEEVAPGVPEAPEGEKVIQLGYLGRGAVPWYIVSEAGCRRAGADLGFDPIVYLPPTFTVEDQVRVMESWVAMGIDGILIEPNEAKALISVIDLAIDTGIPIILADSDAPESKRLLFVGLKLYDFGVSIAKGTLAALEVAGVSPPGKITYHTGFLSTYKDLEVHDGWLQTIEAAGFEAVEPLLDESDSAVALSNAETALALYYPGLVAMSGFYDYTAEAIGKAITDAGLIDKVVGHGVGLTGAQVPFLETGALDGLIDCGQFGTTYFGFEILYKLALAGPEGWDDVLKEYVPGYPADTVLYKMLIGWLTPDKVDYEVWPEIEWIKSLAEHQAAFAELWDVIR